MTGRVSRVLPGGSVRRAGGWFLRVTVLGAVLASLLLGLAGPVGADTSGLNGLSAPAAGGLVTVPPVDGLVLNSAPQILEVAGVPVETMVLTDQAGGRIAFTSRPDGSLGLPRLLPGVYELAVEDQVARFAVEGPAGKLAVMGWDVSSPPSVWPFWVLAVMLAVLGLLMVALVRRRRGSRWVLVGSLLPLVAAGCVAWVGAVVVASGPVPAPFHSCLAGSGPSSASEEECGMRRLTFLLGEGDFEQAVDELAGTTGCHDFGHEFARRAFVSVQDMSRLTAPERELCTEGFLHGLMYSAAMYLDDAQYGSFMDGFCEGIKPGHGFSIGSCAHGVGHGWLMRTNGRLADAQAACEASYAQDQALREECLGATIFEYIGTYVAGQDRPEWRPWGAVEPEQLCASMPVSPIEPLRWCYSGLAAAHALEYSPPDREYAAGELRLCAVAEGAPRQQACVDGVSRAVTGYLPADPENAAACRTALPEGVLREVCARQFAYSMVNATGDASVGARACAPAGVAPEVCRSVWDTGRQ